MSTNPLEFGNGTVKPAEAIAQDSEKPADQQTFLDDQLAMRLCDRYEASKDLIEEGEDWPEAIADFIPFIDAYARDDDHEDLARGLLARLFERSYLRNRLEGGSIEEFSFGVLEVLSQLRNVPGSLLRPRPQEYLKRQPSFFESMMATIKRYRFMEELPSTFEGISDAIIVGGSMGYGPFFSVRDGKSAEDPSDVDAIIVLTDDFSEDRNWQKFLQSEALENTDKISLLGRFAQFATLLSEGEVDIMSQRFDVPGRNFNMSAHFMLPEFFEAMNGSQLERDIEEMEDKVFGVRDLKPREFEHPVCAQNSFNGEVYEYVVPQQVPVEDGGYIATLPGYIIANRQFYPGLYQNLISPEFQVLHDNSGETTEIVDHFRRLVLRYIEAERQAGHIAEVGMSHIRSHLFAPGRYDHRINLTLVDSK